MKKLAIIGMPMDLGIPSVAVKCVEIWRNTSGEGDFLVCNIFAQMHKEKGTMDPVDHETYTSLFEAMVMTPYFPHPNLLIYLEGTLDNIIDRIHDRGRPMEQQTPIAYWEEMHGRYEKWIDSFNGCPVLRLNINDYDIIENPDSVEAIVERIGHFMEQTEALRK